MCVCVCYSVRFCVCVSFYCAGMGPCVRACVRACVRVPVCVCVCVRVLVLVSFSTFAHVD